MMRCPTGCVFDEHQVSGRALSAGLGGPGAEKASPTIAPMKTLRNAHLIARFVLVWFALSIGVAMASPIVKPLAMELICSGAGVMKLLLKGDDADQQLASHTLDCPLCATSSAPPPALLRWGGQPVSALGHVRPRIESAHIASLTAAPLPARGPPAFS